MTDNLPAQGAGSVEIVADPKLDLWGVAAIAPVALLFICGALIFGGVFMALVCVIVGLSLWGFTYCVAVTCQWSRLRFDDEGVTLRRCREWFRTSRPYWFRWDEVAAVMPPRWWQAKSFAPLIIRLNRPTRFWTLRFGAANKVMIPRALCKDGRLVEAVRTHVPAERVQPGGLDMSSPDSILYAWCFALAMFACAAIAARSSLYFPRAGSIFTAMAPLVATLAASVLFIFARHEKMPAPLGFVYGLLLALGYGVSLMLFPMLLLPNGLALVTGWFGACAGVLLGAGVAIFAWKRVKAWPLVIVVLALTVSGSIWGWSNARGLTAIRVGKGSLSYRGAWTPNGDAFLTLHGGFMDILPADGVAYWYSHDLKLERRFVLPEPALLIGLGQNAALFRIGTGSENEKLLYAPRSGESHLIGETENFHSATLSPDGRYALLQAHGGKECKVVGWGLCDLKEATVRALHPPASFEVIRLLGLRNDGTVIWAEGSFARDKGDNVVTSRTPVPESGNFPHPGKPFVVKAWSSDSNLPPTTLYAAKSEWLEWPRTDKAGKLKLCRVSESTPACVEYVLLDLSRTPLFESPLSQEAFEAYPTSCESYDGRYVQDISARGLFARAFIKDTLTGKEALLPISSLLACFSGNAIWSPAEHKFLIEVPVVGFGTSLWSWRRSPEHPQELFTAESVVYMVDMDKQ